MFLEVDGPDEMVEETVTTSEYKRQPVPENALLRFKDFIGMYEGLCIVK